ncbi:MAG TPA: hypothetical protein DDY37_02850, partial [Legionella sp.]|nr:hypothetical protein [Legionella sp.]
MINKLPIDLLLEICGYLNLEDIPLIYLALLRTQENISAENNCLWKRKLKFHFPEVFEELKSNPILDWYKAFKTTYTNEYTGLSMLSKKLFSRIKEGDINGIIELHRLGANFNGAMQNSRTPAHIAAQFGQVAVLKKLNDLNVDLNAATPHGKTPAHFAAEFGHVEVLEQLYELGANLNA